MAGNFNGFDTELIAQQYTNLMEPVIQQGETRTSESAMLKTGLTVRDVQVIDWLDKLTLRTVTDLTSVRATVVDTATAQSRWLPAPHLVEHCIRKSATFDLLTLVDQDSAVRSAQIKAFKTHMDKEFYDAAIGNAITNISLVAEVAGTSPAGITSPYEFVALPAANTITPAAGSSITEGIDEVLEAIDAKDVDTVANPVVCYITSGAKKLLFEDPRYDNWNNMGTQVLASGDMASYRGVKFVRLSDADVFGAGNTKCLVVAGKPVCVGIWSDLSTKIDILPEHSYARQIYTSMSMAAARLDEDRVFVLDIANL
jgi:hypothetical protein